MSIHEISRNRSFTPLQQTLKLGQVIQGKIVKLYPDNKAQIQLGAQIMIAQLEASLTVGERYHFQVHNTDEVIHLKVLGEHLKSEAKVNIINLIDRLGLKTTKLNINFVQALINEKIPFEKEHLIKAFQFLDSAKNKGHAQQILKEMIAQKLPVTNTIYQAFLAKATSGFSDQMNTLLQQLKQDVNPVPLQRNLIEQLSQLIDRPLSGKDLLVKQIIDEVTNDNQRFFNVLKASGSISNQIDFKAWKSDWETLSKQNKIIPSTISNGQLLSLKLPFKLNEILVEQSLSQLNNKKALLQTESQILVQKWANSINQSVIQNSPLPEQDFTHLKQEITQKIMPILSSDQHQQLEKIMQNNPASLRQLLTVLQTFSNEQIYNKAEQFLSDLKQGNTFISTNSTEQFLTHIKQVLHLTGLSHENLLAQDMMHTKSATIKSMLIQMVQQGDHIAHDRGQQLLHFINGLQLQSVNETSNFIQASLQIPGEKIALNSDLFLEFESKKTKSGTIDPDYCRILFYLDLANLKETIIDMNVQKRLVTVTIYNDQETVKGDSQFLQTTLKEGLEKINYQLTNVSVKPLQQMGKSERTSPSKMYQNSYEGIDYRI